MTIRRKDWPRDHEYVYCCDECNDVCNKVFNDEASQPVITVKGYYGSEYGDLCMADFCSDECFERWCKKDKDERKWQYIVEAKPFCEKCNHFVYDDEQGVCDICGRRMIRKMYLDEKWY